MAFRKVYTQIKQYPKACTIMATESTAFCNSIEFYNAGSTVGYIGTRPIPVGAAWSPATQPDFVDTSNYDLKFEGGADGLMVVSRVIFQTS